MKNRIAKPITHYLEKFRAALANLATAMVECGRIYAAALDENPRYADVFRKEFSDTIPPEAWSTFEAVGRGWMHPKLAAGMGGRNHGRIKRLPYSTQERIFDGELFEFVTADGEILNVDVRQVSGEQAEQLFDGPSVRDPAAQRSWLEARKAERVGAEEPTQRLPYDIRRGHLIVRKAGTEFTKIELRRILEAM